MNVRRPVPPLRGWIIQQLVKLAVADQISERVIVMADSDLVFIRPVTVATFAPGGRVRLYRMDDGVGTRSLVICGGTPSPTSCWGYRPPRRPRCPIT